MSTLRTCLRVSGMWVVYVVIGILILAAFEVVLS